MDPIVLAESMIASSEDDMRALGCKSPDYAPRVSRCIPEIINMVEELIANEAAMLLRKAMYTTESAVKPTTGNYQIAKLMN